MIIGEGHEIWCTSGSFHWARVPLWADFAVMHRRMRRSVRTRLLRDRICARRDKTSDENEAVPVLSFQSD